MIKRGETWNLTTTRLKQLSDEDKSRVATSLHLLSLSEEGIKNGAGRHLLTPTRLKQVGDEERRSVVDVLTVLD